MSHDPPPAPDPPAPKRDQGHTHGVASDHGHTPAHAGADADAAAHGHGPACDQQGHGHDHAVLRRASSRALWAALVILAVFFVVELVGGVLTNSLALVSDAAHLLTDVAAIALALFAQWFARKPGSATRSFGYRRVEILAALLNGFTLLGVAVYIAVEAWGRLRHPPVVAGVPMIVVAAVGLVAQVAATAVLHGARGESLNVRGAYVHAATDAVQSVGVVAGGVVMQLTGWYVVDPAVSVAIGLLIIWSGGKLMLEATHVLIEGTPRELDLARIAAAIGETPGVTGVTDLHAWSLTSGYNFLSAHVAAAPSAADAGHDGLRAGLTQMLRRCFAVQHVTLQIEEGCEQCQTANCCAWLEGSAAASPPRRE